MKTSGWIASVVGAVVVVGGGIWGVAALASPDEPETAYTGAYEPAITETPEPVETATVEPDESVEPAPEETVTPGPGPTAEEIFLEEARIYPAMEGLEMTDDEILEAGWTACEYIAELGTTDLGHDIWVIDSSSMGIRNGFAAAADEFLCN